MNIKFLSKTIIISSAIFCWALGKSLKAQYVPGELLVEVKEGITTEELKDTLSKYFPKFKLRKLHNSNVYLIKLVGIKSQELSSLAQVLSSEPNIKAAEPNYVIKAFALPNDTHYLYQWALQKIQAPFAWNFTTGDNQTVIGVIDTGIDINHSDLKGNLWVNSGELLGIDADGDSTDDGCENNTDDDMNGYIDDCYGFNAILGRGSALDDNGHGTHVAGIIGAVGNNGLGVAGLNWKVSMVGCKFLDSQGSGTLADLLECYYYIKTLKQNGVPIVAVNESFGGYYYSVLEREALSELGKLGILVVAAAGNDGVNNDIYGLNPCSWSAQLKNVICVAATDENDNLASFSNYGAKTVQVVAPGVNILSTYLSEYDCDNNIFEDNMEHGSGNWITYGYNNRWSITPEAYVSPYHSWSDSPYSNYWNYTNSYLELRNYLNLSGIRGDLCISFNISWALEPGFDYLYFQVYNGSYWSTFRTFNGFGGWHKITIRIPYSFHQGTPYFKIRFNLRSDCCITYNGVYIDDVKIGTGFKYYPTFKYLSGTSMATPFVTGLVGLLKAYANKIGADYITSDYIKNLILNNVDKLPSLTGLVSTGGRINAFKAISALDNITNIPKH